MAVEQVCETRVGQEAVVSLLAAFADRCRADAAWLTRLHDAGRAVADTTSRLGSLDEFSGDEIAAALGWSRSAATRALNLADDVLRRLPEVHAAMSAGALELAKARVLSDWTRDLEADHAHHVCAVLLPDAPRIALSELIERVQAVAVAVDPDWARRREAAAQRGATVFGAPNPSGTANLIGKDLPVDDAVAAMARVDAMATLLRRQLRSRGVHHGIAWLRAQVYLRLLDGTAAGQDDATVLSGLRTQLAPPPDDEPDDSNPDDDPDETDPKGPQAGPDARGRDDDDPDHGIDSAEDAAGRDPALFERPRSRPPDDPAPDDPAPEESTADERGLRRGVVAIRIRLSSALGLDDQPGPRPHLGHRHGPHRPHHDRPTPRR